MRVKVLVVDDEPLAREGLKRLLGRQAGIESVSEARNGREAIAIIRERPPDLVLLDVQMPRMDGFAVVHRARTGAHARGDLRDRATTSMRSARSRSPRSTTCSSRSPRNASPSHSSGRPAGSGCRRTARRRARSSRCSKRSPSPPRRLTRFAVRSGERTLFVPVEDVDRIKHFQNYVQLHIGETTHLLHVPMSTVEGVLIPSASCASIGRTS